MSSSLRGLANPIGIKCGPALAPDDAARACSTILDPGREPGRITLIARMGHDRIAARAAAADPRRRAPSGHPVLWSCDPMHGNTMRTAERLKTRPLARILAEIERLLRRRRGRGRALRRPAFRDDRPRRRRMHRRRREPGDADIADRYHTHCDPRLNPAQAMELAEPGRRTRLGDAHRLDAAVLAGG